jgi:hypothetical protein
MSVPFIDLHSNIINSNKNIEDNLNKGVVRIIDKTKEGIFIFGHSSSKIKTKYSYIFTRILDLEE